MDNQQAHSIIKSTLEQSFDKNKFIYLAKNLLNNVDESKAFHARGYVAEIFKDYVKTYERIGTYTDPDKKKIDVLIVYLQKETSIERARTSQRNFVAHYLKGRDQKDAGLIAFVSPNEEDWRFSFVKMEYRFEETPKGSVKVKEDFTPAKRYSFLVGKNENSHTAQSRLVPLLKTDERNPRLEEIEDLFSVEKATKEFFDKYRDLYLRTHETLELIVSKDKTLKQDFAEKNVSTVDFCKKLLGQIVFLYFLQRKGWFGVPIKKTWGEGDKKFLRSLFNQALEDKRNYFNDYLEPLFYEALAKERSDDYYSRFECRIPFLNGGLFDPINNYDWVNTTIDFPNELFSNNNTTKEGDKGDGILDIFDRFNFTVKEDEPLEKEVAVDPEMLGKVFENLLEVKDRKSKGTYYTPREIVHYMCVQSLVNYLATELEGKVSKEDISTFIKYGELANEYDAYSEQKREDDPEYKGKYKNIKMPESIREHARLIDDKLADIKVCDPAIGSGAFPVGMMTEIVRARATLSSYLSGKDRTHYNFKRHCIHNSLYGVDIDPGAIEIAKLRLWLSLIVDEEDIKQIKPLPNLDYKIMQGNSLLEEYEGIKLFDDKFISGESYDRESQLNALKAQQSKLQSEYIKLHSDEKLSRTRQGELKAELEKVASQIKRFGKPDNEPKNAELFEIIGAAQRKANKLKELHKAFFDTIHKKEKDSIRKEIESWEWELIEATLKEQNKTSELKKLGEFKKTNIKPFFLWKLNFPEVFQEKGGFDVAIANPPYLKERDNKSLFEEIVNSEWGHKWHQGKMDFWYFFLHKALDVLRENGSVSFITSRYWLNSAGARKLINRIKNEASFISIVDIGKLKVFDEVAGHHMVAIYRKGKTSDEFVYNKLINNISDISKDEDTPNLIIKLMSQNEVYSDDEQISFEEDFISYSGTISLGDVFDVSQGVVQNPDRVSKKTSNKYNLPLNNGVFVLNEIELNRLALSDSENKYIKPFYDENDIHPYLVRSRTNKYLLYLTKDNCDNIKQYPNLYRHLHFYRDIMLARRETQNGSNEWFHLHWPRKSAYFEKPRIILPTMFAEPRAGYQEESGYYGLSSNVIIELCRDFRLKYLLALLNSSFAHYWFIKHGKKRGVGVDIGVEKLRHFPVKKIRIERQDLYLKNVDAILAITITKDYLQNDGKKNAVLKYQKEINRLVYDDYGLSADTVARLENYIACGA